MFSIVMASTELVFPPRPGESIATYVTLQHAQERLPDLIASAESGEEIVITRDHGLPMRLVPVPIDSVKRERRVGGQNLLGITYIAPDFDEPMSDEELAEWGY